MRLRALRAEAGLTGAVLAERAGVGQPTVSKIENGRDGFQHGSPGASGGPGWCGPSSAWCCRRGARCAGTCRSGWRRSSGGSSPRMRRRRTRCGS
ncbi:helix-turn-helix domain-containing protein [Streptomyces fumanus]|uniref:helix-turn-helix domain-containing protein n=1 Tax=Streptomyces fumanus TaxID=67302 RepID=UPI0033E71185